MTDIVVVGSINVDLTSYLARWPEVGETVGAQQTRIGLGGKGANQAVSAARLGASVALVGATGNDGFGQDATNRLCAEGVRYVQGRLPSSATGMAFIDVGPDGGNIIRLAEGANATLSAQDIRAQTNLFSKAKVLLLQNEIPIEASVEAAKLARAMGVRVIMDPAPAPVPFWGRSILENFDIVTPNAHETHKILGQLPMTLCDAQAAAEALRTYGPRGAVVTMGSLGVAWSVASSSGCIAAPKVKSVDTVAAGDCFNGALASGLAIDLDFPRAVQRAVFAAALTTMRHGAAEATPHAKDLKEFTLAQELCILEPSEI